MAARARVLVQRLWRENNGYELYMMAGGAAGCVVCLLLTLRDGGHPPQKESRMDRGIAGEIEESKRRNWSTHAANDDKPGSR
jgi:hypothetical protein